MRRDSNAPRIASTKWFENLFATVIEERPFIDVTVLVGSHLVEVPLPVEPLVDPCIDQRVLLNTGHHLLKGLKIRGFVEACAVVRPWRPLLRWGIGHSDRGAGAAVDQTPLTVR